MNLNDIRTFELKFEQLVVGSTLQAALFSYSNGIPLIYKHNRKPHIFDGNKLELWNKYMFYVSTTDLNPLNGFVETYRINTEEKYIEVYTTQMFKCIVRYEKLFIFDDEGLDGLPAPINRTSNLNEVLDWYKSILMEPHNIEIIEDKKHDLVNKIWFYKLTNTSSARGIVNQVAVSYIKDSDLNKINWSETYTRLKTLKMLEKAGIQGNIVSIKDGKEYRRKLNIDLEKREVYPLGRNIFSEIPNIEFRYDSIEDIQKDTKLYRPIEDLKRFAENEHKDVSSQVLQRLSDEGE